jgi:hypothetical protein
MAYKLARVLSRQAVAVLPSRVQVDGFTYFSDGSWAEPHRHTHALAVPWQCPSSAPVPPQGAPGGSGRLETPRREAGPLGAPPLPQVPERAASKAAGFTAVDHSGGGTREPG